MVEEYMKEEDGLMQLIFEHRERDDDDVILS
jgi:hypothetical protein